MYLVARVSADPLAPLPAGKRSFARARLNLPARLVTFSATGPCTLIDVSRSGARLGAADCPRVGAMVVVEGLPVELFGTVRWAISGLFACEFETPLALERVVDLRRYADAEGERQRQAKLAYAREWATGRR